jgi:dolichyl-phosphate-mannose-protein mannosyltransferase
METLTYIKPGTIIRLEHTRTKKHLHSHDVRPPVSEVDFQNEVSGYGFEGFEGDVNDNWVVEFDESGELLSFIRGLLFHFSRSSTK